MASDTAADCSMNLRLLINKKSGKILYAEAGKDFVDLLFSFLTLPTGSVIKLLSALKRAKRVGCLTNLYNSVEKLQSVYMNADKSPLLEPNVMSTIPNDILRIQSAPTVYYVCGSQCSYGGGTHRKTMGLLHDKTMGSYGGGTHRKTMGLFHDKTMGPFKRAIPHESDEWEECDERTCGISSAKTMSSEVQMQNHYMTTQSGGICCCGQTMSYPVQMHNPSMQGNSTVTASAGSSESGNSGGGYVKETVTFIITNELEISPASTITSIKLLNKLKVKDLSDLDERNASVGPNEALDLLCACLVSATALDDVFGAATSECSPRPEGGVPSGESYETAEILEEIVH